MCIETSRWDHYQSVRTATSAEPPVSVGGAADQPAEPTAATVEQPIDSEEKARCLSTDWIMQLSQAGYDVGLARWVNQMFVVRIVESAPAHRLRHQLVVSEEGRIIAMY